MAKSDDKVATELAKLWPAMEKVLAALTEQTKAFNAQANKITQLLDLRQTVRRMQEEQAERDRETEDRIRALEDANLKLNTKLNWVGKVVWPVVTTLATVGAVGATAIVMSGTG